MKIFDKDRLPELTKILYAIQQKGIDKNCEETLRIHYREVEKLLEKTHAFAIWKDKLRNRHGARDLVPEIFMDAYISILFACMGLYKQANICLRAQLETALRLVYFSTHPVEFKWWCEGSEWYLESKSKDVWGPGYQYFIQLEEIRKFEKEANHGLFNKNIKNFYKKLSKYVHGGVASFQTRPDRISPKYIKGEFNKWADNFKKVQSYVNIVLILGFAETFKSSGADNQRKILKVIEERNCKPGLRRSLGLRLRGRI